MTLQQTIDQQLALKANADTLLGAPHTCDQESCDKAKALLEAAKDMVAVSQDLVEKFCDDCNLSPGGGSTTPPG